MSDDDTKGSTPTPYIAPRDYATKVKAIEALMRATCARIRELGADTAIVVVTIEDAMDGKTGCLHQGLGNIYARRGSLEVAEGLYATEYVPTEAAQEADADDD